MTLSVAGGAGSTVARLEDLERFAGTMRTMAEELAAIGARCGADALRPALLVGELVSPGTFVPAETAMIRAAARIGGQAVRLGELGIALGAAARAYRTAEEVVERGWETLKATAAYSAGVLTRELAVWAAALLVLSAPGQAAMGAAALALGAGAVLRSAGAGPDRRLAESAEKGLAHDAGAFFGSHGALVSAAVDGLPEFLDGLLGTGIGGPPRSGEAWPRDTPALATLVVGAASRYGGLLGETPVEVGEVTGARKATPAPAHGPGTVGELFRRTLDRGTTRPGQVRIERVRQPDGTSAWIVEIPATQSWSPRPGELPTDLTTNVNGVAGLDTAMMRVVKEAMSRLDIPEQEPVLLSGYSQGGITAAGLAADPEFLRRYDVRAVFTVGSPVAAMRIPEEVRVLSVEHDNDLVPALDGAANPVRPNWTTFSRRVGIPEMERGEAWQEADEETRRRLLADPFHTHRGTPYEDTIREMERSGGSSLAAWMSANRMFFSGGESTSRDFAGRRVQRPTGAPDSGPAGPAGRRPGS